LRLAVVNGTLAIDRGNNFRHVDQPLPQREGMSAFALKDAVVHHTYSTTLAESSS
jgi:hypothetical protein